MSSLRMTDKPYKRNTSRFGTVDEEAGKDDVTEESFREEDSSLITFRAKKTKDGAENLSFSAMSPVVEKSGSREYESQNKKSPGFIKEMDGSTFKT